MTSFIRVNLKAPLNYQIVQKDICLVDKKINGSVTNGHYNRVFEPSTLVLIYSVNHHVSMIARVVTNGMTPQNLTGSIQRKTASNLQTSYFSSKTNAIFYKGKFGE